MRLNLEHNKKKVLFVGSFVSQSKNGTVGGQMYACRSLLQSQLSETVDWILIDTTADSNLNNSIFKRLFKAIKRLFLFKYHLLFSNIDTTLIFTGDGFSFWEKGTMALLAKMFGKKAILAPRSGFLLDNIKNTTWLRKFIVFVFQKVDFVICQGNSWKTLFSSLVPSKADKFVVVNNWIDYSIYQKADLTQSKSSVNILFMAWVDKNKGIFELIEAAKILAAQYPNLRFIIAGHGQDYEESIAKVNAYQLQQIFEFRHWVLGVEKIKMLSEADIFILPSYAEGFPNSLMEAMASGLAVVASDVGSVKDAIQDGVNGFLIRPKSSDDIVKTLDILISNQEKRITFGKNAHQHIVAQHSAANAISIFKKLFN